MRRRIVGMSVVAVLVIGGCASSRRVREVPGETLPPLPPTVTIHRRATTTSTLPPVTYVVQDGDTLARIASRLDVELTTLVVYNQITDPDEIAPGDVLLVPPADWVPTTTTTSTVAPTSTAAP